MAKKKANPKKSKMKKSSRKAKSYEMAEKKKGKC